VPVELLSSSGTARVIWLPSGTLTIVTGSEAELYVDADESAQKDNPARDHAGRVFRK
jgi:hypothetical protein